MPTHQQHLTLSRPALRWVLIALAACLALASALRAAPAEAATDCVQKVTFEIRTGGDDLRGHSVALPFAVVTDDRGAAERQFFEFDGQVGIPSRLGTGEFSPGAVIKRKGELETCIENRRILALGMTYTSGGCFACTTDNWDLASFSMRDTNTGHTYFSRQNVHRFKAESAFFSTLVVTPQVGARPRILASATPGCGVVAGLLVRIGDDRPAGELTVRTWNLRLNSPELPRSRLTTPASGAFRSSRWNGLGIANIATPVHVSAVDRDGNISWGRIVHCLVRPA